MKIVCFSIIYRLKTILQQIEPSVIHGYDDYFQLKKNKRNNKWIIFQEKNAHRFTLMILHVYIKQYVIQNVSSCQLILDIHCNEIVLEHMGNIGRYALAIQCWLYIGSILNKYYIHSHDTRKLRFDMLTIFHLSSQKKSLANANPKNHYLGIFHVSF